MRSLSLAAGTAKLDASVGSTEDLLRILVDSVGDYAIFLLDTEGYIVSWNTGAERIKGWTAQEIIGKTLSNHPDPFADEDLSDLSTSDAIDSSRSSRGG